MFDENTRKQMKLLLKMMDYKDEYDANSQMWGVDWKRRVLTAMKKELDGEQLKQLETMERMLEMLELMKVMGTGERVGND